MELLEEETSLSLPYFNPFTHPPYDNKDESSEPIIKSELIDDDIDFDDIETDNFLSNDPLHKWQTLYSLVDNQAESELIEEPDIIIKTEMDNQEITEQESNDTLNE